MGGVRPILSYLHRQLPPGVEFRVPLQMAPIGRRIVVYKDIEMEVDDEGVLVLPSVQYVKILGKGLEKEQVTLESPSHSQWKLVVPQDKLISQASRGLSPADQLLSVVQLYRTNLLHAQIYEVHSTFSLPGNFDRTVVLSQPPQFRSI